MAEPTNANTYMARALQSQGWTKKVTQRILQEQNADLRYHYLHQLLDLRTYHLISIDESGCGERAGAK
ncbi:hypothetical protein N7520_000122 [Penicillium odoratum]|uniref:uncharacterized protein n=1 Tax=Penicillium odoratum TaxID=1167516 RepID=UPI0025481ACA|nr:uncharacterized protein N7520_000122 [Penicillium odoratum]KAJ5776876.1 hypothetical protein N7520_000122 [Penicillium odoratum]